MEEQNKTILIGKDKDPYEMPLNLIQLAIYLRYFPLNSNRELNYIFGLFELDAPSRREYKNTIDFKTDVKERRNLLSINKGLSMELFTSGIFGYIDHPEEVHANCQSRQYRPQGAADNTPYRAVPNNFAQGGVPDVQIDYGDYSVILEVSAKYQPSIEHFTKQLEGALKHARLVREAGYDKPIYCLCINERSLNLVENKLALKTVKEGIKPTEQIYITVISIDDLATLGQTMDRTYEKEITKVSSEDLHQILKATMEKGGNGKFDELFMEQLKDLKGQSPSFYF
jgi:hypothetical protein